MFQTYSNSSQVYQCLFSLSHQRLHDLHGPLELCLLLIIRLLLALTTTTSPRPTVDPLQIFTPPCNARVHPIDVLAARWELRWDRHQNPVQLIDKGRRMVVFGERLWRALLERWGAIGADDGGYVEVGLAPHCCYCVDCRWGGWGEATCNACKP